MTQAIQPLVLTAEQREAFTIRTLRYLDGNCAEAELQELNALLGVSATLRQLFVEICRVHGDLYEAHAERRAALAQKKRPLPTVDPAAETLTHNLAADDTVHPEATS
jgi:hypothetical protein